MTHPLANEQVQREIESVLGAAEAVVQDEIDLSDATSPEAAKIALLELIEHIRDQLCSHAAPAGSAQPARLDADRTAQPKTEIVGVYDAGDGRPRTLHSGMAEAYVVRPTPERPAPKRTCGWCRGNPIGVCLICQAKPSVASTYVDVDVVADAMKDYVPFSKRPRSLALEEVAAAARAALATHDDLFVRRPDESPDVARVRAALMALDEVGGEKDPPR